MKFFLTKDRLDLFIKLFTPFLLTRSLLLWVAWYSQYFLPSNSYSTGEAAERGFIYSRFWFVDVWARWDSGWYLSIVKHGYQITPDLNGQSNVAFFPFYPFLIKIFLSIIPSFLRSDWLIIVIGIGLSNIFLLASIWLLYKLAQKLFKSQQIAESSVWFLLLFPASFIFSCFYTESLFLFLILSYCFLFINQKYWLAAMVGMLAALTRFQGVLLVIFPLVEVFIQLKKHGLIHKDLWKQLLVAASPLIGLLVFLIFSQFVLGDWALPLTAQSAWGKTLTWPWQTILNPVKFIGFITPIDKWITIFCLMTAIYSFKVIKNKGLSILSLLLILLPLFTGVLHSISRYLVIIFPLYFVWGYMIQDRKQFREIIFLTMLTFQVLLFAAWCRFYWVM